LIFGSFGFLNSSFKKYWFFIRNGKVIEQRDLEYGYNKVIYRDHKINCDETN